MTLPTVAAPMTVLELCAPLQLRPARRFPIALTVRPPSAEWLWSRSPGRRRLGVARWIEEMLRGPDVNNHQSYADFIRAKVPLKEAVQDIAVAAE